MQKRKYFIKSEYFYKIDTSFLVIIINLYSIKYNELILTLN